MNNEQKNKNSAAKIKANNKWTTNHYKRMYISTTPDQADYIRETAKKYDITIVQLIIDSIKCYEKVARADTEQPEQDPTKSPMESEETAGAQPEQETETETEDEKPEEIPAFVWEQIQRLKKADKRQTAERKAREAAERKRRRAEEGTEDY